MCATPECSDQIILVTHWWRGATQNTWSEKRWSCTMVWAMVSLRSDQRTKSGKWSEQWSHYSLIIGHTKLWAMVALRSDQRPISDHRALTNRIFYCSFTTIFHDSKENLQALQNEFLFNLSISVVLTFKRYTELFSIKLSSA